MSTGFYPRASWGPIKRLASEEFPTKDDALMCEPSPSRPSSIITSSLLKAAPETTAATANRPGEASFGDRQPACFEIS